MLQLLLQVENPGLVAVIVGGILTVGVSIFVVLASLVIFYIVRRSHAAPSRPVAKLTRAAGSPSHAQRGVDGY